MVEHQYLFPLAFNKPYYLLAKAPIQGNTGENYSTKLNQISQDTPKCHIFYAHELRQCYNYFVAICAKQDSVSSIARFMLLDGH